MSQSQSTSGNVRGRPPLSEEKMADMRKHITKCAFRLFREHGYTAVSMRRLASEAGCTVMTLYRYFDRKIDILRQLWSEVFVELFNRLEKVAATENDPVKRLHSVALGYVNYWLDQREHYFLVFMSSDVSQSDVSIFVEDDGAVDRFNLFRIGIADALDADMNEPDISVKTQLLLCTLNGIAHNLITISAYPWAGPDVLVRAAVSSVLGSDVQCDWEGMER